jgi:pre-mRNA-processing factor 8
LPEEDDAAQTTDIDLRPQIAMQQVPPNCSGLLLDQNTLAAKSKSWRNTTKKRFSERKKFGYVEAQKELLPPEVLR